MKNTKKKRIKTGAQILVDCLKKEKVKHIFGYPGGSVIDIFNVLYDEKNINFILTRHEQAAAHAADGYARASGKVGVCIATSGPGATNLVTGIATAYMDSIPIVAITGQVPSTMIGNDAFQEADITGITRPITKHNYLVKDVKDLARTVHEAFYVARTGRPGPVLIDITKNVQQAKIEDPDIDYKNIDIPGYKPKLEGNKKQIQKAAELIKDAERPVIYAGGGVVASGASNLLRKFAEKIDTPVTTTLMGLGCFPVKHRLSLHMLGMHGTYYANYAIMNSDLIIAIGARFDDRVTGKLSEFAPNAKIIHIDIDPTSVSKNVKVDVPIVGDAKKVLEDLLPIVKPLKHTDWLAQISEWKKEYPLTYKKESNRVKPQYVIECIYEITKGNAIIATEVGQHQMWAAQFYPYDKPRTFLSSGGLGTMGYGFPAAIGAKVACPDKPVFDIAGDGSIQMNIQELATVVLNKIDVKIIVLNNSYLGMVRQWQELFYDRRYASTSLVIEKNSLEINLPDGSKHHYVPDFVKLAQAYGAYGMRVSKNSEVKEALKEALKVKGPVILEFVIEKEENVFPMVPAGASLKQIIGGMA